MPHQSYREAKTSAKCLRTSVKGSSCPPVNGISVIDYAALKRTELQQQCKKLGLRATGKVRGDCLNVLSLLHPAIEN